MGEVNIIKPIRFDGVVVINIKKKGARSGQIALTKLFQDFRKFSEKEKVGVSIQRGKKKLNVVS